MTRNIGELCNEIIRRSSLSQYLTEHMQEVGRTSRVKWDPNRPPTGTRWGAWGSGYDVISVPRLVSGRRIAVIDKAAMTIEALVVSGYKQQDAAVSAIAGPGHQMIKINVGSGLITAEQARCGYAVNLAGKKVVGLTRREMAELLGYAKRNKGSAQLPPQNL